MISGDKSAEITDHISGILLRYFRKATRAGLSAARLNANRDREMLRLHWSISPALQNLVRHILENRHETQGFLSFKIRQEDGTVRGRIDARATVVKQIISGHTAIVVSHEAIRSYASGPNHVVGWVLQQASLLANRFLRILPNDASYLPMVSDVVAAMDQVRKIDAIRSVLAEINLTRRPSPGALREAAQSRRKLYRLAYLAFIDLAALEAGDPDVVRRVLHDTILAPIEIWRRFELAVGLSVAEALAKAINASLTLNFLAGNSQVPIACVGRFGIFWQTVVPELYRRPDPEPSEVTTERVLVGYGMRPDADRPDLIVADLEARRVVSVIEVKYFTSAGEDAWDRLRDAARQVVRYCRGYRDAGDLDNLLAHSIVALAEAPTLPDPLPAGVPLVIDFERLIQQPLEDWAHRFS